MRYKNQEIFVNISEAYKRYLTKTRGVESIKQYDTPVFRHPTVEEIKTFNVVTHVWKTGDRYFKLADQYYQRPELWWIIAHYNKKPSESSVNLGDVILIPTPIDAILYYL